MLWAPQWTTQGKSICRLKTGSIKFVPHKRERNQGTNPQQQMKESRLGKGRPKRPTSKVTPKLPRLAIENRYPKLNSTETLIWAYESKRSLCSARTQLSTLSYTVEISKSPISYRWSNEGLQVYRQRDSRKRSGQPTAYTQWNWYPKPEIDNQHKRGVKLKP